MKTVDKVKNYLKEIEKNNQKGKEINSLLQLNPYVIEEARRVDDKIKRGNAGRLAGKVIAVKANINVKGLNASCASKTLENYKSSYDADVIKKIKDADGVIIGMANMDEFASGSSGETSAFGPTRNPANPELISGGSSSGSAASVAAGFCDVALGSDTGGSIRNPASHCGVIGLKPTYGSVSRYGLIDLSMSLDQIGVFSRNIFDATLLLDVIKGKSERDGTSIESKPLDFKEIEKTPKLKVGVLDLIIGDERIRHLMDKRVEIASKRYNWEVKKVKLNYLDLAVETYYPLVYVEFYSGTRKFDGRRFGTRIEEVAGPEVLRRILGGSEISKAENHGRYYHRALKVKKLVEKEFDKYFKKFDCLILPTVARLPHVIGEDISLEEMYNYDSLTIPSNLAGNCAISIPIGKVGENPVGMQVICDKLQEQKMFQIARSFEKIINE